MKAITDSPGMGPCPRRAPTVMKAITDASGMGPCPRRAPTVIKAMTDASGMGPCPRRAPTVMKAMTDASGMGPCPPSSKAQNLGAHKCHRAWPYRAYPLGATTGDASGLRPEALILVSSLPGPSDGPGTDEDLPLRHVLGLLSEEQRALTLQSLRPRDRALRLLARWLLLKGLELVGQDPHCQSAKAQGNPWPPALSHLSRDHLGRPTLLGSPWFVSLSHSYPYAVCALAPRAVGVDVERISPLSVGDFRSVFTPREMAAINDSLWPQSELIRRWTIKEAILKALGLGFLADPLALDTSPREPERLVETKAGPLRWDHLDLAQDFWLSWAILDTGR